ncbi:MAG: lamin tail domain-containing protein [Bacteroidales bacterium]|nr:lamin tail domain-containing protein [Bacteroidales bacterium]
MNIKAILLFYALLGLIVPVFGQLQDDFSDGDFTRDPAWQGDTGNFIVNKDLQLQLNASESGEAWLYTALSNLPSSVEWRGFVKLSFAPSNNNWVRIYLASNSSLVSSPNFEAFYLQMGENGSNDAVELYHQVGGTTQRLCRGKEGRVAAAFALAFKVIKDENNLWYIYLDENNSGYYELDSYTACPFMDEVSFFGLYAKFTSSNSTRMYFDDFRIHSWAPDTVAPTLKTCRIMEDGQSIGLTFSENIHPETALLPENYLLLPDGVRPLACFFDEGRHDQILLSFAQRLEENKEYKVQMSGLSDESGNRLSCTSEAFAYRVTRRHDVLISEIMADPSPMVELPDAEYVELYNRTSNALFLRGWHLTTGKYTRSLPDIDLPAHDFALLVPESKISLFVTYPNVYPVSGLSLTDGGMTLSLTNTREEVIHHVNYRQQWHQSSVKRDGGWSLEMKDPLNPCGEAGNWDSSISPTGGTPCSTNSIAVSNPDLIPPLMERVSVVDSVTIDIFFSEPMLKENRSEEQRYAIDHGVKVVGATEILPAHRGHRLTLTPALKALTLYTLTVTDTLTDCAGIPVSLHSNISFGIAQQPTNLDLVINEILTSSANSGAGNYVEIYNRSDKIIDLKDVLLGCDGDLLPKSAVTALPGGGQILPRQYAVLCKNKSLTIEHFFVPYPEKLFILDSFPTYHKNEGIVHLLTRGMQSIDRFAYRSDMHYAMLKTIENVSLERTSFEKETNNAAHWKSAAENAGFGTPGYLNSQFIENVNQNDVFNVYPDVFSPDGDGFDDFITFTCCFADAENRLTISIYDTDGHLVTTLVNNAYAGIRNEYSWDGTTGSRMLAPPALYIALLEYWNASGKKKTTRKVFGLR